MRASWRVTRERIRRWPAELTCRHVVCTETFSTKEGSAVKRIYTGRHRKMLALIAGVAAVAAIGLVATTRRPRHARRHAARQPVRRLRVPRPLQAVRGVAHPGVDDQGRHPELRGSPHASSRSTSRPAQARTTSRRSRSASSPQFTPQPQNLSSTCASTAPERSRAAGCPGSGSSRSRRRRGRRSASARTSAASRSATGSDLFKKAGLPTNRAAVSKLWPTWQTFIDRRQALPEAKAPKGTSLLRLG